jgi:predicted DCC family thiol-disulfide oxidoreductase YuxK
LNKLQSPLQCLGFKIYFNRSALSQSNTTTKLNNTRPFSSCEPCSCNPLTTWLTTWFYDQIASRRIMGLDYNWFTNRNTCCVLPFHDSQIVL